MYLAFKLLTIILHDQSKVLSLQLKKIKNSELTKQGYEYMKCELGQQSPGVSKKVL